MRYCELLTERASSYDVHRLATEAIARIMAPLGRNDVLFHYQDNIAAPVQTALRQIAAACQDPAHPLDVHLDFTKHGGTFGSFNEDGARGFMAINLHAILDAVFDLSDSKWDKHESVMDLRLAAHQVADVFSHEFLHYRQHLGSWGKARRKVPRKVARSRPSNHYLAQSAEIQAFATDAARELQRAFGALAIEAIRDGRATAVSPAFRSYVDLGSPTILKLFLRHLVAALREPS